MNACQSNCKQGRDKCPTPDACQLPDADPHDWLTPGRFWVAYFIAAVACVVAVWP